MPMGYESTVVNGQMVNVAPAQGYNPLTFGQAYTGPGFWPRNGVYNVPPVTPSAGMYGSGSTDGGAVDTGNQPTPTAGAIGKNGGANYFHPTKSPMIFALVALIGGVAMLHFIHFK